MLGPKAQKYAVLISCGYDVRPISEVGFKQTQGLTSQRLVLNHHRAGSVRHHGGSGKQRSGGSARTASTVGLPPED